MDDKDPFNTYKDKFKKAKAKNHCKNNHIYTHTHTHTQIINQRNEIQELMKII
jgi:hypothetical protein